MIRWIFLIFFLSHSMGFAQADNIELPNIELVIDDQSMLNAETTEDAILKERNPQFQEVYLEELTAHITDASFDAAVSQRYNNKKTCIQFMYGSYHNTQVKALSQDLINNLLYHIAYKGQIRDNVRFNDHIYLDTGLYNNLFDAFFSYGKEQTIFNLDVNYRQVKNSFLNKEQHSQYIHYIPIDINTKHWIDKNSYLDIGGNIHTSILENRNSEDIRVKHGFLLDSEFNISYNTNLADWNFFTIDIEYWFNDYNQKILAHTGIFFIRSDFELTKGFCFQIGAAIIGSSLSQIFGWPEIRIIYNYLELFVMDMKFSGDYNLYDAEKSSVEWQFFDLLPTVESRWVISSSFKYHPNAFIWFGGTVEYSYYKNKRIYSYNNVEKLYAFTTLQKIGLFSPTISFGAQYPQIFDLSFSYSYQNIPKNWLLYFEHQFEALLGLGYIPAGFLFQTKCTFYSKRNLTKDQISQLIALLGFKIAQKIYQRVEIFIEIDNVLNQNIQFIEGTYYGGIQAHGGVQLNF